MLPSNKLGIYHLFMEFVEHRFEAGKQYQAVFINEDERVLGDAERTPVSIGGFRVWMVRKTGTLPPPIELPIPEHRPAKVLPFNKSA